jgi:hypothetical protein
MYDLPILYRQEVPNSFQETGAGGGFRLDAIKHMDSLFLCKFVRGLVWVDVASSCVISASPYADGAREVGPLCSW